MTPAIGQQLVAPWGRYQVHRLDGAQVVLRDLDRPGAFVLPAGAALERYTAVAAELPAIAAVAPLELQLGGRTPGRRDRAPAAPTQPAPPPAAPTSGSAVCSACQRPRLVLAYVGDLGYCWRCYGVSEAPAPTATSSASGWRPEPAEEVYESRAEVGSFAPPPAAEQVERPRPKPAKAARVKPQEWLTGTGEAPR